MKILILIVPVVAAAAVCFAYLMHKHKNNGAAAAKQSLTGSIFFYRILRLTAKTQTCRKRAVTADEQTI